MRPTRRGYLSVRFSPAAATRGSDRGKRQRGDIPWGVFCIVVGAGLLTAGLTSTRGSCTDGHVEMSCTRGVATRRPSEHCDRLAVVQLESSAADFATAAPPCSFDRTRKRVHEAPPKPAGRLIAGPQCVALPGRCRARSTSSLLAFHLDRHDPSDPRGHSVAGLQVRQVDARRGSQRPRIAVRVGELDRV